MSARINVLGSLLVVLLLSVSCEPGPQGQEVGDPESMVATEALDAPFVLPTPSQLFARFVGAPVVVVGTVSGVRSYFGLNEHGDELILSRIEVTVEGALRGSPRERLVLELEGGTVGDVSLRVSDMPKLTLGDRGVFAVRRAPRRNSWVVWGRSRGILLVDRAASVDRLRTALSGER